ncbi:MAG: ribosome assembly RNA-binding protein YhbY [Candidatus Hydrogenedentes bacterium]|nr:ribosome assembly RNA-binding protein YhbY [Candidatus Hydrogenedentota bacterium]
MDELRGSQRRYLRSLANRLRPLVQVGRQGVTDTVVKAMNDALDAHELVKVKFVERKDEKEALAEAIAEATGSHQVGMVGHTALFYRQQKDEAKRKIDLAGR